MYLKPSRSSCATLYVFARTMDSRDHRPCPRHNLFLKRLHYQSYREDEMSWRARFACEKIVLPTGSLLALLSLRLGDRDEGEVFQDPEHIWYRRG